MLASNQPTNSQATTAVLLHHQPMAREQVEGSQGTTQAPAQMSKNCQTNCPRGLRAYSWLHPAAGTCSSQAPPTGQPEFDCAMHSNHTMLVSSFLLCFGLRQAHISRTPCLPTGWPALAASCCVNPRSDSCRLRLVEADTRPGMPASDGQCSDTRVS